MLAFVNLHWKYVGIFSWYFSPSDDPVCAVLKSAPNCTTNFLLHNLFVPLYVRVLGIYTFSCFSFGVAVLMAVYETGTFFNYKYVMILRKHMRLKWFSFFFFCLLLLLGDGH